MRKSFLREPEAGGFADRAIGRAHFAQYRGVVGGVGDDRDVRVVLGGTAHHGRPADVDVFDRLFKRAIGARDGLAERIEIDDHQVDERDAGAIDRADMRRHVAPRKYAAVNFGMQGLDPAVEHFGKTGVIGHFRHADAAVPQQFGGAAGREQRDAETGQSARELDEPGLVGNAEQRGLDDGHKKQDRGLSRQD